MNDEFTTEAITNDRYLKAARLTDQFEEEIARELRNFLEETIEERPDLFADDASPSMRQTNVRTEPLAHTRMQADLSRVNRDGENLIFYVSIQWTQPEIHNQDADGALCLVLYKIKNVARAEYDRVKQRSQSEPEWAEIQYSDDVWSRNRGIFYVPVTDGPDISEGLETLREHFYRFVDEFGSDGEPVGESS
jgi:hypothetical protein